MSWLKANWKTIAVVGGLVGKALYDASQKDFAGVAADIGGILGTLGLMPAPVVHKAIGK